MSPSYSDPVPVPDDRWLEGIDPTVDMELSYLPKKGEIIKLADIRPLYGFENELEIRKLDPDAPIPLEMLRPKKSGMATFIKWWFSVLIFIGFCSIAYNQYQTGMTFSM